MNNFITSWIDLWTPFQESHGRLEIVPQIDTLVHTYSSSYLVICFTQLLCARDTQKACLC